ncbi:hypothetical protein ACFXPY_19710 [Streptomyces sp. NPDC059153]|uniref:hypothetical protein n=1 Tax=Streptomyces sp. NPDC059153 TaxID=3346743 RepID=UPI0036B8CC04
MSCVCRYEVAPLWVWERCLLHPRLREDGTITLWICTTGPGIGSDECSIAVTDRINS